MELVSVRGLGGEIHRGVNGGGFGRVRVAYTVVCSDFRMAIATVLFGFRAVTECRPRLAVSEGNNTGGDGVRAAPRSGQRVPIHGNETIGLLSEKAGEVLGSTSI